jgi:type VI secretion system secreted protein VgrG
MSGGFTQTDRLISIETPLGQDKLLLRSFTGTEGISRLFHFNLDLASEDFNVDFDKIVGKSVTVRLLQSDGSSFRFFHGYINRFAQLPVEGHLARYEAEMVPWLWLLTRTSDCRIFQDKTVPQIIEQVFRDYGFQHFELQLNNTYDQWNYCVQYQETACNFVTRLMEQEGIFFFFRHEKDKHVLVLADKPSAHRPCPGGSKARYEHSVGEGVSRGDDVVDSWRYEKQYQPGKFATTDYNFEIPSTNLLSTAETSAEVSGNKKYEIFDFPGEYEKRNEGDVLAKLRMEEDEAAQAIYEGAGNCRFLIPGFKFELTEHDRKDQNKPYTITSVTHSAYSGEFYSDKEAEGAEYANNFTCIPHATQFRPARVTPKPVVHGPQTAVVTGPSGEEIYTDKYGRVKVQFHWDRKGKKDDKSSCWIRVSQPWAGKNWGGIWIPRLGQEVIVGFLEGDPDRPIITGRVYNAEQMPPYDLPANHTQSGFRSRSSKGGGSSNYNELRFEDKKGSEEINIQAEKDMNTLVKHDETKTVQNDQTLTVQHDRTSKVVHDHSETVGNNQTISIAMDQSETIGKNQTLTVSMNQSETVGVNKSLSVGSSQSDTIGAQRSVTVGANDSLTVGAARSTSIGGVDSLSVGGALTISASAVVINAGVITLNAASVVVSGVMMASTVITSSVVSPTYTPGVGNMM